MAAVRSPMRALSPCFHLNISFLCAIQIPRPFFSNGALGHAIPRVVVTLRNFFCYHRLFPAGAFESGSRTRRRRRRVLSNGEIGRKWFHSSLFFSLLINHSKINIGDLYNFYNFVIFHKEFFILVKDLNCSRRSCRCLKSI